MQRAATLFALGCTAALLAATAASADRPAFNPVCNGTKIDPVSSGTYDLQYGSNLGTITITVYDTPAGQEFDFQTDVATDLVTSVVAKGGTAYSTSTYAAPGTNGDVGLHAPLNPHSGFWYDLSYLCFTTGSGGGEG
ncbi:MAG TPA: hypothetical protein VMT74_05125 [Gaiellaceae bacterium]|nr:hypothetical protein [Gaiellaceae bacterium]